MRNWLETLIAATMLALIAASPVSAREWQVRMLNKGSDGQAMVFEPAYLEVASGDTVRFVPSDKGHNAESLPTIAPAGAAPFRGKINEELVVKFTAAGLYGYKCLPHLGLGMVGLIRVGKGGDKTAATAAAMRLPGKGKLRMADLIARAR